ncbi:amidohydrolase [Nocardioides hungaricus]
MQTPSITRTVAEIGPVDVVLADARIWTGDAAGSWATTLAVAGGRLVAVGGDDVRDLAGPGTRIVSVEGRTVIPGLIDAHVHPVPAGQKMLSVDLGRLTDRTQYAEAIASYAATLPADAWVRGGNWSFDAFPGGVPTAAELDPLVGGRPAVLPNRDGHTYWVSTRALELAGIDRDTPDPADGRIERDAAGDAVGALQEGAMRLVDAVVPAPTEDELLEALLTAQAYLHSIGITGWQDAKVFPEIARTYARASDEGLLTGDVTGALWWDRGAGSVVDQVGSMVDTRQTLSRPGLRFTTTKMMLDGVAENFTAAMLEAYVHQCLAHDHGLHFFDADELREIVLALDAAGQQIHFHAVGDAAVREGLDMVELIQSTSPGRRLRHHIAHIQVMHPDDAGRFARLGVAVNAQPLWARLEPQMTELTMPFLGERRAGWQYPWGTLDRTGAVLAFGSDWPVSTPEPFRELHVAVNRTPAGDSPTWRPGDGVFLPEERLSLSRALRAFTMGSAWVNGTDHERGSLEPGKYADFAILDRDPFSGPTEEIWTTGVEQTWIAGRPVHGPDAP